MFSIVSPECVNKQHVHCDNFINMLVDEVVSEIIVVADQYSLLNDLRGSSQLHDRFLAFFG